MDGETPAELFGYPCMEVQGFEGFGRLCYLTLLALDDLLSQWSSGQVPPSRIAVVINLPTSDVRPLLLQHLVRAGVAAPGSTEADVFLGMLQPLLQKNLHGASLHILHGGHAGGAEALRQAQVLLNTGSAEICLVGGVDSYLDAPTLEWLDGTQKLKTPEWPVGFIPGEGAAFLAVERLSSARAQHKSVLALLGPLSLVPEKVADEDRPLSGEALAQALHEVLERNPERDQEVRVLLQDLNGEESRASEWGSALVRLREAFPQLLQLKQWLPTLSFGDVGCATFPFLACAATQALARGYSPGNQLLLTSSSEEGLRAALILSGASPAS